MNILAIAPKPPYVQVAEGTFTLANARMSLVDGTAFFDCGADLSAYAGLDTGSHEYLIKVYDDDGYSIQGYVGAVGGGEALDTEEMTDPTFDDAGEWTAGTGWSVTGGKAVATAVAYKHIDNKVATIKGTLYKEVIVCDSITNGVYIAYIGNGAPGSNFNDTGTKTGYGISTSTGKSGIYANTGNLTATFTDISLKSLTDCAVTGFHIISAQGGSTQNWTSVSASFNYNDSDGYSYKIWKVR